jgi:hypothetical protein
LKVIFLTPERTNVLGGIVPTSEEIVTSVRYLQSLKDGTVGEFSVTFVKQHELNAAEPTVVRLSGIVIEPVNPDFANADSPIVCNLLGSDIENDGPAVNLKLSGVSALLVLHSKKAKFPIVVRLLSEGIVSVTRLHLLNA